MSLQIKNELFTFLKKHDIDILHENWGNSCSVYGELFNEPVKRIFYWKEEDYGGRLFVIYEYKSDTDGVYYAAFDGEFGSCSGCDTFEGTESQEELDDNVHKIFADIQLSDSLDHIEHKEHAHPDLVKAFALFKTNYKQECNER
jgi:hypothetical protein